MFKIKKIILLFLVYNYTLCSGLIIAEGSLTSADGSDYGRWIQNDEVTEDMKDIWRIERDKSIAYRAKAGRLEGIKRQKPDGNILVIPFTDKILTLRSSIYPLGHIYRAYDSQDLADLLLEKALSKKLKLTDYLYKQISSLKVFLEKALKLYNIITQPSVGSTLKTKNPIKSKNPIKEFDSTLQNIKTTFTKVKNPPNEYRERLSLLNRAFSNFNFDIYSKDMNTKVEILNNFNNKLQNEYQNLDSSIILQLKGYINKLIEYLQYLKDKKLPLVPPTLPDKKEKAKTPLDQVLDLCKKLLEYTEYDLLNKKLKILEEKATQSFALAHTEMMFRYYICQNGLTAPENIYSYFDLCNKCEQMLANDIDIYTEKRGFYAISEIKFNNNINYTTPDSSLKKYRLPYIDSATIDSKTEEKSSV